MSQPHIDSEMSVVSCSGVSSTSVGQQQISPLIKVEATPSQRLLLEGIENKVRQRRREEQEEEEEEEEAWRARAGRHGERDRVQSLSTLVLRTQHSISTSFFFFV